MIFRNLFGRPALPGIGAPDARARQQAGALIVDVREPHEWQSGHIPGAVHIPLASLRTRLRDLDPQREVIVVCRSGNRSAAAVQLLQSAGYATAQNLEGGMIAWSRHGLPVTRR